MRSERDEMACLRKDTGDLMGRCSMRRPTKEKRSLDGKSRLGEGTRLATRGLAGGFGPIRRADRATGTAGGKRRGAGLLAAAACSAPARELFEAEASREGPRPGLHSVVSLFFFVRRPVRPLVACCAAVPSTKHPSALHLLQLYSSWSTVHHGPIRGRRLNKPSSKPV